MILDLVQMTNFGTSYSETTSLLVIQDVLLAGDVTVDIEDRIIPIMRFQSTYELCPEYVSRLESLFVEK